MLTQRLLVIVTTAVFIWFLSCSGPDREVKELAGFSCNTLLGLVSQTGVMIDGETTSDGDGSLRVTAEEPTTVRLFVVDDPDVEDARLIYRAKLRSENIEGKAYLEMWCRFPGRGEFFSRGLDTPLTGTTDWVTEETHFFLKMGENPDEVKLNLVIDGTGTVWIDDIRLLRGPLE